MGNTVYGVGVNDADYILRVSEELGVVNGRRKRKVIWKCPYYSSWVNMLCRCYSEKYQKRMPTYIGCSVCEEWLTFSNFKEWMEGQDWKGKSLDKDILVQGNKVYCPSTCVFIPEALNNLLAVNLKKRGEYPIGVCFDIFTQRFMSSMTVNSKSTYLGRFDCPLTAHKQWQIKKASVITEVANSQADKRIRDALLGRANKLQSDIENNKVTEKL